MTFALLEVSIISFHNLSFGQELTIVFTNVSTALYHFKHFLIM